MSQFPIDDQKYGTLIIDKKNVLNMIGLSFKQRIRDEKQNKRKLSSNQRLVPIKNQSGLALVKNQSGNL